MASRIWAAFAGWRAYLADHVVAVIAVLLFAGWLASKTQFGVAGVIAMFVIGAAFGALVLWGCGAVLESLAAAPPPQNNLGICPRCGRPSLRKASGFCAGCGSLLYDDGIWVAGDMRDPVATYLWDKADRQWVLLTTRSQRAAARPEVAASAEALLASRTRPAPRLIRRAAEAEELSAEWIRWMGFEGAAVTGAGADGGIDVFGSGRSGVIAAQVKFEAVPAGRPKLQQLYGAGVAAGASTTAFFSSAGFTAQAIGWAGEVGMALFEFGVDGSVMPANEHGQKHFLNN